MKNRKKIFMRLKKLFIALLIRVTELFLTYLLFLSMGTLGVLLLLIVVILCVSLKKLISHLWKLMNYESRKLVCDQSQKCLNLLISIVFRFLFQIRAGLERWIGYRSRTFCQSVLYSKSFIPFRFMVLGVTMAVGTISTLLLLRRVAFVLRKLENDPKLEAEGSAVECLIVMFTSFGAAITLTYGVKKMVSYSLSFWQKIFDQLARNRVGAGLICGFISTATMSFFPYILLVPRLSLDNFEDSFFFEHQQERVAAITGFFLGQCLKFLFFYNFSIYEKLYQWKLVVLVFLIFLLFQVFWTHETIVKNWDYLYRNDKRKRVLKRILFVQAQFMANFGIQLLATESRIEKLNSTVRRISLQYIPDTVFVSIAFLGWFLGHAVLICVYMKVFGLLRVWVYPAIQNIFESKGSGGDGRDEDRWDLFRFRGPDKDKK